MRLDLLLFLFLSGASLFLILDHIYLAAPAIVALSGLFLRWKYPHLTMMPEEIRRSWTLMLMGFGSFAVSVVFLNIIHGDLSPRNFERIIPFLVLPAVVWTIRGKNWDFRYWLGALGLGCFLALMLAVYETGILMLPRADGAASNAISFGHISVVMGAICAVAAVCLPPIKQLTMMRVFLLGATFCAMGASLLSGSKGGWPSMVFIAIVVSLLATSSLPRRKRAAAAVLTVALVVLAALLAPQHIVMDRILSGIEGATIWFASGSVVEGSVSARLELWRLGFQLFTEAPFFGHGAGGLALRWAEMVSEGAPFSHLAAYRTIDNELLGALAEGGVFGALGYFCPYVGVFFAFWPWRRHEDDVVRCLALTGLVLVPVHLLFGLSVSVLGISMFRVEYVTFTSSLLAFLSLRLSHPES